MYVRNYIQIYLWKIISIITGFMSLVLVIPQISANTEIYSIYAYVISLSLYFTYADLGFLSSGQKYASEAFAKSEPKEEARILGFTVAVLICMFLPMMGLFVYFYLFPSIVFGGLSVEATRVASGLFLILALFVPLQIVLQRSLQMVLAIRLQDFISIRIDIFFNLIKLISIFYFFSQDSYMIVEYFFFCTMLTIMGSILGFIYVKYRLEFKIRELVRAVKLSNDYYRKTKSLAFSSAAITIGFLLFYELDLILVGYLFGIEEIAIYAIAFTLVGFVRRIWSIIYSPISIRINHFVGLGDNKGVIKLLNNLIYYTFPICIIMIVTLILFAESLISTWVGMDYIGSIILFQVLLISFIPAYLTNPGFHYFISHERTDYLYGLAFIMPFLFYINVILTYEKFGLLGFAFGKVVVTFTELIICWSGLRNIISPGNIIKKWILPIIAWTLFAIYFIPVLIGNMNPYETTNTLDLLQIILLMGGFMFLSYLSFFCIFKKDRLDVFNLFRFLLGKFSSSRILK